MKASCSENNSPQSVFYTDRFFHLYLVKQHHKRNEMMKYRREREKRMTSFAPPRHLLVLQNCACILLDVSGFILMLMRSLILKWRKERERALWCSGKMNAFFRACCLLLTLQTYSPHRICVGFLGRQVVG